MGGLLFAEKGIVNPHCEDTIPGNAVCDHTGEVAADTGKTFGLVSTIGVVVGLAGGGTAAALFATAAKKPSAAWLRLGVLSAGSDGAMVGVRGGF